jgi:predicted hotdog family 3-hydroxylacyl-ACP dehydratase
MTKLPFPGQRVDYAKNKIMAKPSLTRQSDARDADINNLLGRYVTPKTRPVLLGDFTAVPDDLMGAFALVERAAQSFATLPAAVRFKFRNQPVALVAFLSDPSNKPEAIRLGLILPDPVVEPVSPVKTPDKAS